MRRQVFPLSKQVETRLRIMHAVDRPIDELTCAAICAKADVSRQLFYRYFDSKFDIPYWFATECDRSTISEIGRSLTWEEGFSDFFSLLHDERKTLRHFTSSKESRSSRHRADARRADIFCETIALNGGIVDGDLRFYAEMYANCFNKAFATWIDSGMERAPEDMARLVCGLVPPALRKAVCGSKF